MNSARTSILTLFATVLLLTTLARTSRSTPSAPTGFAVAPPTACGAIWLSWSPVAGVTGYNLYRNGVRLTSLSQGATRYYDYEVADPGTYTYAIESYVALGTSVDVSPQVTGTSTVSTPLMSVDPWDWFQDVFPANNDPSLPGTARFDTCGSVIRTAHNFSGLTGNASRPVLPGSNVIVHTEGATSVDIVYRIKPGPGNYETVGNVSSGLMRVLARPSPRACPLDGSYWGPDIGGVCPNGIWDTNKWITKSCDPVGGSPGDYQTTSAATPIFPDGLFSPGTVVQYYFVGHFPGSVTYSIPDPSCVMQVAGEHSTDGHRWEQFTVLPDRWKDNAYGGGGAPCALVVDLEDARGNERIWSGLADSIGATHAIDRGHYNGWSAPGVDPANLQNPVDLDSPAYIVDGIGAAGTTWDLYSARGWQSSLVGNAGALGGRLGVVAATVYPSGPTLGMLETYYKTIILLSGDRDTDILGPLANRSQDDIQLLQDFLQGSTLADKRAVVSIGNGFVTSEKSTHPAFVTNFLQVDLRNSSYPALSGSAANCTDMTPVMAPASGNVFAVINPPDPGVANDVLDVAGGSSIAYGEYAPTGPADPNAPYVASVLKQSDATHPWQALSEGWNLRDLLGRFGGRSYDRLAYYYRALQDAILPITGCTIVGTPITTTDVPGESPAPSRTQLLELRNNPTRQGSAAIHFALATPDKAEARIYDLAGRVIRDIPARDFAAGDHLITWDGKDDSGRSIPRGVYYARVWFARSGEMGQRKIVMLK